MKKLLFITILIASCGTEHDFHRQDDTAENIQVCLYDEDGLLIDYDTVPQTLVLDNWVECVYIEN